MRGKAASVESGTASKGCTLKFAVSFKRMRVRQGGTIEWGQELEMGGLNER